MSDLISRQAAIDVAREEIESGTFYDIPSKIEDLPSALPPHGRLIDADALEKTMKNVAKSEWNIKAGVSTGIWCGIDMLEDAMTIIEAEVEEW